MPQLFPDKLLDWAGHRDGGVKKPFAAGSGRPTKEIIETQITRRLRKWANDLPQGIDGKPLVIFLIGGPGNGKTDAIETTVEYIGKSLGIVENLIDACKTSFEVDLPPRKLVLEFANFVDKSSPLHGRNLVIVQDATEIDTEIESRSPESLFLDDIEYLLNADENARPIFLCGINRGILAHAALVADAEHRHTKTLEFISALTQAATSKLEKKSSWPLDGYKWAVGWPMDVESLVNPSFSKDQPTPVLQILENALQSNDWVNDCNAKELCPFHTNRILLNSIEARRNLSRILHFYELASGKRWNFRDLFSLVSQVLVGHESVFMVDSQPVSPCVWATHHANKVRNSDRDQILSAWLLTTRLYTHALFPRWPKLPEVAKEIRELDKSGVKLFPDLHKLFIEIGKDDNWGSTSVGQLLSKEVCPILDPANTRRELQLNHPEDGLTTGLIEEAFTTSIHRGLEISEEFLTPLEVQFLKCLLQADEVSNDTESSTSFRNVAKVKRIQWNLRALASRLVKRSLAGREGVCRDHMFLENYQSLLDDTAGSSGRNLKNSFKRLLSEGGSGKLTVPLSTTFGQPAHSKQGEARLLALNPPTVEIVPATNSPSRPREQLPYLKIDNVPIPVTFPLFKALSEVQQGLMTASLPEEIFALVDGTRNVLAGRIVHQNERIEDAQVEIGGSNQKLVIEGGKILDEL